MSQKLPEQVTVVEVGPRDGLQNEATQVPTEDKLRLINALADAGLSQIEITSFVSPKWIPQMADAAAVARQIRTSRPDLRTSALVPNDKGYDSALETGMKEIALFMSATETHNKKNINKTVDEAFATLETLAKRARADKLSLRFYLSVVFVCPYEGKTNPAKVAELIDRIAQIGADEISLGDTIGAATPKDVWTVLEAVDKVRSQSRLALHFHDTRGTALANVLAGLEAGITIFDASVGGMGGCPYAPGAAGNLATEDLVYMLDGMGIKTGIDLEKLVAAGELAQSIVGRTLPGRYLKACLSSQSKKSASIC